MCIRDRHNAVKRFCRETECRSSVRPALIYSVNMYLQTICTVFNKQVKQTSDFKVNGQSKEIHIFNEREIAKCICAVSRALMFC